MFTIMEDIEDLKKYWLQILIVLVVESSLLYGVFRKKEELHTDHTQLLWTMHRFWSIYIERILCF
jgi:hypothetical protein